MLQEARVFNESHINARQCQQVPDSCLKHHAKLGASFSVICNISSAAGYYQVVVLTLSRGDFQQGSLGFLFQHRYTLFAQRGYTNTTSIMHAYFSMSFAV